MNNEKLAIIILNYKSYEKTIECIDSILNNHIQYDYRVYIVDNNSPNDSYHVLSSRFAQINNITCIKNSSNSGYAAGNNVGIREAMRDQFNYIMIANNDVVFQKNAINTLISFMIDHPDSGAVGPKILDPKGTIQKDSCRNKLGFKEKIFVTTPLRLLDFMKVNEKFYYSGFKFDQPKQVYALSGSCMLLRREVFDLVGLLDENTFLYEEEAILYSKVETTPFKVYIQPKAEIIHYHGATTSSNKAFAFIEYVKSEQYYSISYLKLRRSQLGLLKLIRAVQYLLKCPKDINFRKDFRKFLKILFKWGE